MIPAEILAKLAPWALKTGGVLLAVLIVFMLGHHAGQKAERAQLDPKVAAICEAAGATWQEVDAQGHALDRSKWGSSCKAAAKALFDFHSDALVQRAKLLEQHQKDEDQKAAADAAAAARQAASLSVAKHRMEAENASVKTDDRVGGSWFAGLNDLGGLRTSGGQAGGPHGAVRAAPDTPPF